MRSCKVCKTKFKPQYTSLQPTCGNTQCAIEHGKVLQKKEFKARTKVLRKEQRKHDRQWHIKTCQVEFNKYIRLRDAGKPCISCGRMPTENGYIGSGGFQAGHYRSVGAAPELRFEEDNVHGQDAQCNTSKSGNILEYRISLIKKIGQSRVDWIEGDHPKKYYRIPELQELIAKYRGLNKTMVDK